jgi:hypothetical protein
MIGLHAVTEFNQSIRYADTKAAVLVTVQALTVTALVARRETVVGSPLATVLFTLSLLGILLSAGLLAAGQVPRLSSGKVSEGPNRLAFPSLAEMDRADVLAAVPLTTLQEDVWRQAADLADIAMTKYRWLRRAMISTLATLAAVLLGVGVTMWFR